MRKFQRIVFLGDSVTEGCFELYQTDYGFDTVRRPEDGYVAKTVRRLRDAYGFSPAFCNLGESGISTTRALEKLDAARAFAPELAVVCLGLNDLHSEERFCRSLESLLRALAQTADAVIYLTPNSMNTYLHPSLPAYLHKAAEVTMEAQTSGYFDRMMARAREIAATCGAALCDVYALWRELSETKDVTAELLINHINHPTPQMHDRTAALLTDVILSL